MLHTANKVFLPQSRILKRTTQLVLYPSKTNTVDLTVFHQHIFFLQLSELGKTHL